MRNKNNTFEKISATSQSSVIGACPLDCPDGCSWIVDLQDGRPIKLRANREHPFTGKTLCAKTTRYLEYVDHPDRLLYPLRRIGAKGSGQFERVSWDEAISEIASNLQNTIEQFGAEAIWPYAGSGTVGWVQGIVGAGKRLFHYLGASLHDPNICSIAGHVGMRYTTGSAAGMDPEDLVHSKLILLWGTNTIETNQHLWPFIKKARENGAIIVTIDPIRTATAKRSDVHIPLKPGTDAALALGIMQRLVELGAENREYLERRTLGWGEFRDSVLQEFSIERTAEICGLSETSIADLANLIATRRPMGIRTSMGIQRHRGGGQAARVLSCLVAVTGDFQRLGGGICYSTGPTYKLNVDALCRPDLQPRKTRSLAMTRLGQGLLELNDPPIKSLVIWAANPMVSNPDQRRIREGLSRNDLFTVVIDNFQTDTADYADIILPGTMQTEHADLHDSFSHLYLQWNEPIVKPHGECLPHTEIFRRLAKQMGLKEPALYASDEELTRAALNSEHPALDGITLDRLKETGWARLNWPKPYQPFLEKFYTPSLKFEFRSERAEADGLGRFPHYTPPLEAVRKTADGSLALLSPASKGLLNSVYGVGTKHAHADAVTVTLNPEDIKTLGLAPGKRVRIRNNRGEFSAVLVENDAIRPGIAVSPKGLWPKFNAGASVNVTVAEHDADMGRGAVYHDNRVFITPLKGERKSNK